MIPPTLANPFGRHAVGNEWGPPPGSVPDLHRGVLDRCRKLIREVRGTEAATSLLVRGEAGSGKTHLIAQLRAELADDPSAFVLRVTFNNTYVGQVWRYLRAQLAAELLRKRWHPNAPELTGLLRIVRNRFPDWTPEAGRGGLVGRIIGRSPAADLEELLAEFAAAGEFGYELQKVLPRLWDPRLEPLAGAWLRGKTLGEDDAKKLGLPPAHPNDFEQEQIARDVVLSVLRLAGDKTALVICFDELEALLTGVQDDAALRTFTALATDLIAEPGAKVVVTFARPTTVLTMQAKVEHSNIQKMSQEQVGIPPLDRWEYLVQLVLARLHADPACRAERAKHADRFWPLSERFLRDLHERNRQDLTARHALIACRVEFDRLKAAPEPDPIPLTRVPPPPPASPAGRAGGPSGGSAGAAPPVAGPDVPPPRPADGELYHRLWEKRRAHHLKHLHAINFETVLGNGLPWLAKLRAAPYTLAEAVDSRLGDVNLVLRPTAPGGKAIGVSFCHQEPRVLWRRLDRLVNQSQAAKAYGLLATLFVVRPAGAGMSDAAQERFDKLRRGGATVVLLPTEQLAELAAFQELLTKAQTGAITDFGKPVTAAQYTDWAAGNLSSAVKEFAVTVFGPAAKPPGPAAGAGKPTAPATRPGPPAPARATMPAAQPMAGRPGRPAK